ncbi:MAG: cyclic nucleotide-binding domain-containing protein [Spirochaetaceae bacterium]|jgi:CRP-like cAMP-binding protein|nr:cyclic nucleotide-binding domain-containing protein [Spirochaetaceae bacterium]
MPKPLQYRSGSVIYFQGDAADKIFILQSGAVNLAYQDIETGTDVHDLVQPGEFFGVKSALGRYPREENAITLQDAAIMAFTVPEFEALAQANTRIIMKMLKVFSNQLRRIHHQVSNLMEKTEEVQPEMGLYNVGEYYLKNKRFTQAKYVFSRYLTYYPSGRHAAQAAKNLEFTESQGGGRMPQPKSVLADLEIPPSQPTADAFSGQGPSEQLGSAAKAYYDAVSMISQEKYQQAYLSFKKIVDANEDPEYVAKSFYEIGRCLFLLNKYDDCIKYFTGMITKYPRHPELGNGLYFMGQSYEKLGRKDQAATFYKKILTMTSSDDDNAINIKAKRALKALIGE